VDVRQYQRWVRDFDVQRGWDLTLPSEVFVHFMEEVGEIARRVLALEGYKPVGDEAERAKWKGHLREELSDAITFLVKLAYMYDVEVADGLLANMPKCDGRFPPQESREAVREYLRAHREELERFIRVYCERFPEPLHDQEEQP
jgi:NTP pyrophosphatase (non-canonical NTP hydrolase)